MYRRADLYEVLPPVPPFKIEHDLDRVAAPFRQFRHSAACFVERNYVGDEVITNSALFDAQQGDGFFSQPLPVPQFT